MSSILNHTILNEAAGAVDAYISTVRNLNTELENLIQVLTSNDFVGDASDGYKTFYQQKVLPAITTNLVEGEKSLAAGIKGMLDNIGTQLLDTVDPKLGENNQNPGGAEGAQGE